jgi:hypothetical protein
LSKKNACGAAYIAIFKYIKPLVIDSVKKKTRLGHDLEGTNPKDPCFALGYGHYALQHANPYLAGCGPTFKAEIKTTMLGHIGTHLQDAIFNYTLWRGLLYI